jgi:hypothetical protein
LNAVLTPPTKARNFENGFHLLRNGTMVVFALLFCESGVLTLFLLQVSARQEGYLRSEAVKH